MSDDYETIEFAGLSNFNDVEMTDEVASKFHCTDDRPDASLVEAINRLDPVELADVYVENQYTDEKHKVDMANATINPDVAIEEGGDGDLSGDDFTYEVHSGGYAAIQHYDFFEPMTHALREAEAFNVAGQFRVYDRGAQVHGEVVFQDPETQLELEDEENPLFVGLSVGNSYDGTCSMYAMGYAMDTFCDNSMRNLTDKRSRKHIGDPSETEEWWGEILTQMDAMRDILGEVIENALEVDIDFMEQPFDTEEFYELLGLPGYLARAAGTTARNRSAREGGTRTEINFWTLHSGLTSALTHDFSGSSEVGSLETYSRIAKDILWNPANIMSEVKTEYERRERLEAQTEAQENEVDENVATIERYESTLDDRKEEFEEFEEKVEGLLEVDDDGEQGTIEA